MKAIFKSLAVLSIIALSACSSSSGNGNGAQGGGPHPPGTGSAADQKTVGIMSAHAWCYNIQAPDGVTYQVREAFAADGGLNAKAFKLIDGRRPAQADLEKNGSYTVQNTDTTTTITTTIDGKQETSNLQYTDQDQQTGAERVFSTDAAGQTTAWDPCI
jgi:hypothetical protein